MAKAPYLICGWGSIGRRHFRNLRTLGEENIVVYRFGKSTIELDELTGVQVEWDLERALEQWKPVAAVICNPTALHLDVAIPAAAAGCHLLIEKPISDRLDRIDDLRSALAGQGGKVLVGYHLRFHPALAEIKRVLENGDLGRVVGARAHWGEYLPDWHPWEDYRESYSARAELGGGVILTLSHPFDYLRWLFGEVEAVAAEYGERGDLRIGVEDTADVQLQFADGLLASVHLNYIQRPPKHTLEIVATEGTIHWQAELDSALLWDVHSKEWRELGGVKGFERNAMYLDEMKHFIEVVEGRVEPLCSLEDGVQALRIALRAKSTSPEWEAEQQT
jgi:predicted dehydrogenase